MQVESIATPLLTIDEVEKVQRQMVDKLVQQEKLNHCHGLKTLYSRPRFIISR